MSYVPRESNGLADALAKRGAALDGEEESDDDIHHEHARKLKVFKHILSQVGEDPSEGLAMIDAVQRLGIDYHFQDEIEEILPRQHMIAANYSTSTSTNDDLQQVALRFRLLRQEGYNVPAGV
ncbi:hypothetical protein EZV62_006685 [Acer yangbiense]|uniref:Terpene synthase N-terminal domain-containing protein n=1 Tax=Acer yangbiense TaxID=1000413 RepID=A0A5C7I7U3_9ROSI|nr:hypothetical protein EZV62_006685 [Acer yangbiense]